MPTLGGPDRQARADQILRNRGIPEELLDALTTNEGRASTMTTTATRATLEGAGEHICAVLRLGDNYTAREYIDAITAAREAGVGEAYANHVLGTDGTLVRGVERGSRSERRGVALDRPSARGRVVAARSRRPGRRRALGRGAQRGSPRRRWAGGPDRCPPRTAGVRRALRSAEGLEAEDARLSDR